MAQPVTFFLSNSWNQYVFFGCERLAPASSTHLLCLFHSSLRSARPSPSSLMIVMMRVNFIDATPVHWHCLASQQEGPCRHGMNICTTFNKAILQLGLNFIFKSKIYMGGDAKLEITANFNSNLT